MSPAPRRGVLLFATGLVFVTLVGAASVAALALAEALEERQVAAAAIDLRLAAQTIVSADELSQVGGAATLVELSSAVETLQGDNDLALHSMEAGQRRDAERRLDELLGSGRALLGPAPQERRSLDHEPLRELLAVASSTADANATAAEHRALWALLVTGIAAAIAAGFLARARVSEHHLRRDLFDQANTDLLTGLPNRRVLEGVLGRARAQMRTGGGITAMLALDLDGFKDINDTLGHHAGDELLVRVSDRLRTAQRPNDVLLRLGGDEFAVVLPGLAGVDGAEQAAHHYLQVLDEPFEIDNQRERLRVSIGVAVAAEPDRFRMLATEADQAMYDAKRSGGHRVSVFDPAMNTQAHAASQTTRGLRAANYDDEFSIVYQPIVTVDGRTTTGYEALLRWVSPTLGQVGPADFIPVAERSGEICAIGKWVLEGICRQLHAWERVRTGGDLSVSWNVSPHQLEEERFVSHVLHTLDAWTIPRSRLVIEVTESAVLDHRGVALQRLHELRAAGIRIAIDDFGSGYSNLGQLLQVPFDIIKIDRSLLVNLTRMRAQAGGDPSDPCAIMGAIVAIASVFDAPVICEGVETEQQRQSLEASGITHVQGFLTGRPGPAPAALEARPQKRRRRPGRSLAQSS